MQASSNIEYGKYSVPTYVGTREAWDLLPPAEKAKYEMVAFTDQLGGDAMYPANRISYDNTDSSLTAANVQDAIDELSTTVIDWDDWTQLTPQEQETGDYTITNCPWADGNVSVDLMTKLWENPSPSADFTEQSLPLDLSGYDLIMVISNNSVISVASNTVGQSLYLAEAVSGAGGTAIRRRLGVITATGITWYAGYQSTSWQVGTIANSAAKPYQIYGIKTTASVKINAIAMDVKASVEYSTSEHLIGKWVDGSDLYERTYNFGALPNNTSKNLSVGFGSNVIVVSVCGVGISNTNAALPLPYSGNTINDNISLYYSQVSDVITIRTGSDRSAINGYVTLRYTKNN